MVASEKTEPGRAALESSLARGLANQRLLTGAAPVLNELVARLGQTAHLSVLEGAEVLTILSEPSRPAVRASDWSGRTTPAHGTSSGRALLFDHDRAMRDDLFPGGALPPRALGAPLEVAELHRRIVAALNVPGPKFRFGRRLEHRWGAEVRTAAERLSRQTGWAPTQLRVGGRDG